MSTAPTIGIIVFDGVLSSEVIGPAEVFASANKRGYFHGAQVLLIGIEPQMTIRTEEGLRLAVDATIADDLVLDILLVPGASDIDPLLQNQRLHAFIQRHDSRNAWLGSVCAGAFLLASAGVLDGRRATTWFGGEAQLQAQFPAVRIVPDQPVVVDKRRVTANGGLVSYLAALVLLGQLTSTALAREVYESLGMHRLSDWPAIEASITAAPHLNG